jgi:hypothetical protein
MFDASVVMKIAIKSKGRKCPTDQPWIYRSVFYFMARKMGEDIECFYTLTKEIALRLLNGRGERERCTGAGALGDRNLEFMETVEPRKPNIAAKVQVEGATMSFKFMYTSRGISDPPFSPILPYQARGMVDQFFRRLCLVEVRQNRFR